MSATNAWALVAQREISVRLRDKTFIGSTLFALVMIVGVIGFQIWNSSQESAYDLAVTPDSVAMGQVLVDATGAAGGDAMPLPGEGDMSVTLTEVDDADAARAAVEDESVDAWLTPTDDGWQLVGKTDVDGSLLSLAQSAIRQHVLTENAAQAGTDIASLRAGSQVGSDILDGDAEQQQIGQIVGFVMAFLFYMAAIIFGMYLAMSVVEEKQSRIVEIIATSTSLRHLLVGKLVGAVVLAVAQIVLYAVVAVIGASFTPWGDLLPSLTSGLGWFIAFFLAGFTMIASMYAVAGALASRQEDIQSTSLPVTILIMLMFFGAIFAKGTLADVLAWVPPFSAIMQPMGLVAGQVPWWEAVISLVLLVVATGAVILLVERIYRRALMQTSGKMSVKQAWNAEI